MSIYHVGLGTRPEARACFGRIMKLADGTIKLRPRHPGNPTLVHACLGGPPAQLPLLWVPRVASEPPGLPA